MTEELPTHGGQLRQIAERFGIPMSQLLDFSANINPEGPLPRVIPALITEATAEINAKSHMRGSWSARSTSMTRC